MSVYIQTDQVGMLLKKVGLEEGTKSYAYYKYAIELVSQDAARLEQMIKGVYYPMSIHFEDNISNIEREMREAITSIYIKGLEQFEDIMKDQADCYPTVSEVLKILVYLDNLP